MGYHITLLRTKDKRPVPITQEEVVGLAARFPTWKYDADQNALISLDDRDDAPALWYSDGQLWTTNPGTNTLVSMLAFARHLGARVRGDEFETYRSTTETYLHPDDADTKAEPDEDIDAWRRREQLKLWALRAAFIGGAALLAFLLNKFGLLK